MVVEYTAVSSADGRSFFIVDLVFSLYRVLPLCEFDSVYRLDVVWGRNERQK